MAIETAADWATVVAGAAAAFSLYYATRITKKQNYKERKGTAGKVVAWVVNAAVEGDQTPSDGKYRGVVLVNNTDEVLYDVDVATAAEDGKDKSPTPDLQRFGVVPPGALFLPQADSDDGKVEWLEPRPVDHSNSRLRVSFIDENNQLEVRNLVPVVHTEDPRKVYFLRFKVANADWHRDSSGALKTGPGPDTWNKKLEESELKRLLPVSDRQHQPNENAQKLIEQLFARLTQPNTDNTPNTVAAAAADIVSSGIARVRRTQGRGQGIFLMTQSDEDWPRFYISAGRSGKNLEAFPNDGLQFHSAKGAKVERIPVSEFSAMSDPKASDWLGKDQIEELVTILKREFKAHLKNPT
ncbi:MAG TPA: hypothetical protein PLQ19_02600 [Aeromicrobium sp.]|nr:hypothetical protein [Aeromicrobium sp.]